MGDSNVDSCLKEAECSHGTVGCAQLLESFPEFLRSHLILDTPGNFNIKVQLHAAHGLGACLVPGHDIATVATVGGKCRLFETHRGVNNNPYFLRWEVCLHELSPSVIVQAIEDGHEGLDGIRHVGFGDGGVIC